jgi:hypothetical protein
MCPCTDTNENHNRKLTSEKLDRSTHKQKTKGKKKRWQNFSSFFLSFFPSLVLRSSASLTNMPTTTGYKKRGGGKHCKTKTKKQIEKSKDMKPRVQIKTSCNTPPVLSLSLSLSLSHTHTHTHTQSHNAHHCPRRAKASKQKKRKTGPRSEV